MDAGKKTKGFPKKRLVTVVGGKDPKRSNNSPLYKNPFLPESRGKGTRRGFGKKALGQIRGPDIKGRWHYSFKLWGRG